MDVEGKRKRKEEEKKKKEEICVYAFGFGGSEMKVVNPEMSHRNSKFQSLLLMGPGKE